MVRRRRFSAILTRLLGYTISQVIFDASFCVYNRNRISPLQSFSMPIALKRGSVADKRAPRRFVRNTLFSYSFGSQSIPVSFSFYFQGADEDALADLTEALRISTSIASAKTLPGGKPKLDHEVLHQVR